MGTTYLTLSKQTNKIATPKVQYGKTKYFCVPKERCSIQATKERELQTRGQEDVKV